MRWLFLLVFLAACNAPLPFRYRVSISPNFPPSYVTTIQESLSDWSAHVPVTFETSLMPCTSVDDFCIVLGACPTFADGSYDVGCTSADLRTVTLKDPSLETGLVTRHEIGHAMGLVHDRRGTVMCASLECAQERVTSEDAAQWEALRR